MRSPRKLIERDFSFGVQHALLYFSSKQCFIGATSISKLVENLAGQKDILCFALGRAERWVGAYPILDQKPTLPPSLALYRMRDIRVLSESLSVCVHLGQLAIICSDARARTRAESNRQSTTSQQLLHTNLSTTRGAVKKINDWECAVR